MASKIFPDASGQIEQVWKFDLPVGKERTLVAILKPEGEGDHADGGFHRFLAGWSVEESLLGQTR